MGVKLVVSYLAKNGCDRGSRSVIDLSARPALKGNFCALGKILVFLHEFSATFNNSIWTAYTITFWFWFMVSLIDNLSNIIIQELNL